MVRAQLAFERPQIVDVLHEARRAERIGLVENLVADAAALGHAAFGQRHAQPRDAVAGHHDDVAVIAQFVGDAFAIELLDDGGGVFQRQVGKERRHLRRGHAHHEEAEEADQGDGDGGHRRNACGAKVLANSTRPCTEPTPRGATQLRPTSARIARWMVSARLMNGGNDSNPWQNCAQSETPALRPALAIEQDRLSARYSRYCWMRVVRSPASPCWSMEYCQDRNSSTVSV